MKSQDKVTEIIFIVDEFLQTFNKYLKRYLVPNVETENTKCQKSEIITILILYHLYNYKNFKSYYPECVQIRMKHLFPDTVSYNRFLELREKVFFPMVCLLKNKYFLKDIKGKIYGDRGYVSSKIFSKLYEQGIELITKLHSNMKNKLMDIKDRILLNHRGLIESLNNKLKSGCQIEHTRHRSLGGFLTNIVTSLCAYHFMPNKPHLKFNSHNNYQNNYPNQLELFTLLTPN